MHTYVAQNGTIFNYNYDLSGDVHIEPASPLGQGQNIWINAEDILEFVAYAYVRSTRVSKLVQASWKDLLA